MSARSRSTKAEKGDQRETCRYERSGAGPASNAGTGRPTPDANAHWGITAGVWIREYDAIARGDLTGIEHPIVVAVRGRIQLTGVDHAVLVAVIREVGD